MGLGFGLANPNPNPNLVGGHVRRIGTGEARRQPIIPKG